jgi:alpha-tubulin suppressor-like RCC1 family protein
MQATSLSAGYNHTLLVDNTGKVYAWGSDSYGQLGDGTSGTIDSVPQLMSGFSGTALSVSAGELFSLILKSDSTLWACGRNSTGQLGDGGGGNTSTPVQISTLTGVKTMSAGYLHSLIVKSDGTLWACGDNGYGELGYLDPNGIGGVPEVTPVEIIF